MEMHEVRYFLSACETLNFHRAAARCHVTQSALTRAIQKLEAELESHLFLTRLVAMHDAARFAFYRSMAHLADRRALAFLRQKPVRSKRWVVYAKPPFAGPQAVLAYLSRYMSVHLTA